MNLIDNDLFLLKSVTKDTKAKFDALLKASLLKKSSISEEKLVQAEIESISSAIDIINNSETTIENPEKLDGINEITSVDIHSNDKDFIINKFFKESSNESLQKVTVNENEAPVPKARKTIANNEENNSNSSRRTYEIKRSNSDDSNRTYKVDKSGSNSPKANAEAEECIELQELSIGKKMESVISYENEIKEQEIPRPKARKSKRSQLPKTEEQETLIKKYNYESIISIKILKTDNLELDSFVVHPVVKIHLVDVNTGKYLLKSNANRCVLFYYENQDIKYIGPIMTESYNLQKHQSMNPNWNEAVIINEDFKYFMDDKNVILLFEIMDFLNVSAIQSQRGKKEAWHRIAWAFLRHTSPIDGSVNVNKKLRLQLYRPAPLKKYVPHDHCDVFYCWRNYEWKKYPSTLHVIVQEQKLSQLEEAIPSIRSKNALEGERSQNKINFKSNCHQTSADLNEEKIPQDTKNAAVQNLLDEESNNIKWSRSFYQTCKIPNNLLNKFEIYNDGCFLLSFSNNGLFLACAVLLNKTYSILVYSVVTFEEKCFFSAHQDYIYCFSWSSDDRFLISASADWTVCIWDVQNKNYVQMLPHPSFVYSSIISSTNQLATGCYDNTIRIWSINNSNSYELYQEIDGHAGYITALLFNKSGTILFSGDSLGVLKTWKIKSDNTLWSLKREYNILDLKGIVINEIILHPRERRVFIYSRDNYVRLVDLKNGFVMQQFFSGRTNRILRYLAISPCFTLLFCPTDQEGKINIWNINSTKLLASYKPFHNDLPINCIRFHPFDNIVAISQFSSTSRHIFLYKYEDNPKEMIEIEYYDSGKTVNVPPKKPERLHKIKERKNDSEVTRQQDVLLDNENRMYKKNLKEIIKQMDEVIEGKFDLLTNIV